MPKWREQNNKRYKERELWSQLSSSNSKKSSTKMRFSLILVTVIVISKKQTLTKITTVFKLMRRTKVKTKTNNLRPKLSKKCLEVIRSDWERVNKHLTQNGNRSSTWVMKATSKCLVIHTRWDLKYFLWKCSYNKARIRSRIWSHLLARGSI